MYQAKIPPLSSYTYQERGKQTLYNLLQVTPEDLKAPLCRNLPLSSPAGGVREDISPTTPLSTCTVSVCILFHVSPPHYLPVFDPLACSSDDQCLWRPGVLSVQEVEDFLLNAQRPYGQQGTECTQTQKDTVRDNQQVLSLFFFFFQTCPRRHWSSGVATTCSWQRVVV